MPDEISQDPTSAPVEQGASLASIVVAQEGEENPDAEDGDDTSSEAGTGSGSVIGDGDDAAEAGAAGPEGSEAVGDSEPDYKASHQKLKEIEDLFNDNPLAFVKGMMQALTPEQVAELIGGSQQETPGGDDIEIDPDTYEAATDLEAALLPMMPAIKDLKNLPDTIRGHVEEGITRLAPYLDLANVTSAITNAKVDALCELLGITLPDGDIRQIAMAANDGKTTYKEAVSKLLSPALKDAVAKSKQSKAPRPSNPASNSMHVDNLERDENNRVSMATIFKQVGS